MAKINSNNLFKDFEKSIRVHGAELELNSLRQIAMKQFCLPDAAAHKRTASENSLICTEAVQTAVNELCPLEIREAHTGSLHLGLFKDRIPENRVVELHTPQIQPGQQTVGKHSLLSNPITAFCPEDVLAIHHGQLLLGDLTQLWSVFLQQSLFCQK